MSDFALMLNLTPQIDRILVALDERPNAYLVAVVGIPGSGKSTLCRALSQRLPNSVVIPMDGYHLPRWQLSPEEMKRRGAPNTFDLSKLRVDLENLRRTRSGSFPAFDHAVKDPEPDAIHVDSGCSLVIVEGNYLLLRDWNLQDLFDLTIFLDCDLKKAMDRVRKRLFECGITASLEEAAQQVQFNDLVNARLILDDRVMERADLILQGVA